MKRLAFFFLALGLPGCVTPRICTPVGSYESGRRDALAGRSIDLSSGKVCSGSDLTVYQNHYQKGYADGFQTLCQEANVTDEGTSLGQQGQANSGLPERYRVCASQLATLDQIWQAAYTKGHNVFCSADAARTLGAKAGGAGKPLELDPTTWSVCGEKRLSDLSQSYKLGYGQGLKQYCAAADLETRAFKLGQSHEGPLAVNADYQACSESERNRLRQRHDAAYLSGLRDYCQIDRHRGMMQEWAMKTAQPTYTPGRYESCLDRFPELKESYNAAYAQERQAIVHRYCTYGNGQSYGQSEAGESNSPRRNTPGFCDDNASGNFMSGYDQGWAERKRSICASYDGLNDGYQDGLRGEEPTPSYPALCPASYHASLRSAYLDGYDRGQQVYQRQEQARRDAALQASYEAAQLAAQQAAQQAALHAAQQATQQTSYPSHPSHPHKPHPRPTKGEDVVQACGEILSYDGDKMKCINASDRIRHNASALIRACGEAFSYSGDRLQCVHDAGSRNYSPAATVKACQQILSYSEDIKKCMNAVKDSRYEPSRAVSACGAAFSYSEDRIKCLTAVSGWQRDPSPRISSCGQNFSYSGDVMKCLGRAG